MSDINSKIYFGKVGHARFKPVHHLLSYRVAYMYLDLDELAPLAQKHRFFCHNKANLFSFYDKDHGDGSGKSLKSWVQKSLRREGFEQADKVYILTLPRMMGYVFNPISIYYCFSKGGSLFAILYEVNNNFKERVAYLLPTKGEGLIQQTCRKAMHVSPFFEVKGHYTFKTRTPKDKLSLTIGYYQGEAQLLSAWVSGVGEGFSGSALLKTFLKTPFLTFKVIGGIHWEAFKLFLKGLRPFRHKAVATKNEQSDLTKTKASS